MIEFDTPKTRAAAVLKDICEGEEALTLNEARSHPLLMRNGKRADLTVVYRLVSGGAKSVGGKRIYLETAQQRHGQVTTARAIHRFAERINEIDAAPKGTDHAEKLANAKLAAAGL